MQEVRTGLAQVLQELQGRPVKETGQLAYEAYATAKRWKDNGGFDMWTWNLLDAREQDAWRAAAHAAIKLGWVDSASGRHAVPPSVSPATESGSRRPSRG